MKYENPTHKSVAAGRVDAVVEIEHGVEDQAEDSDEDLNTSEVLGLEAEIDQSEVQHRYRLAGLGLHDVTVVDMRIAHQMFIRIAVYHSQISCGPSVVLLYCPSAVLLLSFCGPAIVLLSCCGSFDWW